MRSKTSKAKKSFTLTELLLTAGLIVFALSSLLLFFLGNIFLNEANRYLTVAVTHAQYVMEEIKNTNFNNVESKINNGDWDWRPSAIESQGCNALSNETIDPGVTGTGLLDITVTVKWQEWGGRERTTALETLLAQP